MAAHFNDTVADNGLSSLKTAARYMYICTSEPTNYTEASSTYKRGVKDATAGGIFPGSIQAGTNGRKLTTLNITDGTVDGDGTINWWAICDGSNLLAVGSISAPQAVVNGNTFSLAAFDVTLKTS